ncbi:crinkler family protein [Gigaspora margarita]|uniref:Crinkler family protein n=1 Tax=Gigaspora margarita TaxID=4874 RepID=A0A8H4AHP0_GIGMA|nr:crinkler family protein [Gigaspora margarita]
MDTFSVTCLIEGEDPLDDMFKVRINKNEPIDDLKKLIRVPNEKLKILKNKECAVIKECLERMKLVAFKKIKEYFSEVPEENYLSIIIERLPVIKSTSSLEIVVDLSRVSLNDIKCKVLNNLHLLQDTKADNLNLRFNREDDKNSEELEFKNDRDFQEYLKYCIMTSSLSLKIQFSCGVNSLEDLKADELLKHLYKNLKLHLKAIHGKLETTKSNVVEVKKDGFDQGVAQTAMQLYCSLEKNRKQKRNKIEEIEDLFIDKTYGIITDSCKWYFIECIVNEDDNLKFSIYSKEGTLID